MSKKLDQFHYHEALDRCYIVNNQVETILLEHPVVQKHEKVKEKIEAASALLADAYQMIGKLQQD